MLVWLNANNTGSLRTNAPLIMAADFRIIFDSIFETHAYIATIRKSVANYTKLIQYMFGSV